MKDVFGFAEHQEIATKGLGYELTLQRKSDNHLLCHEDGTDAEKLALAGRVIISGISSYVLHYTPNLSEKNLMVEHFVYRVATELTYKKNHLSQKM